MNHEESSLKSAIPFELKANFFYDPALIEKFKGELLNELKGHMILLGTNIDPHIRVAALIEGTFIDFIFGLKLGMSSWNRNRVSVVKEYLRGLSFLKQTAVANFYESLCGDIIDFHTQIKAVGSLCYLCQVEKIRVALHDHIEDSFSELYTSLYQIS